MEAENYLASGYGLRLAIEERNTGWQPFEQYARVWQPSRLKGIQVGPEFGTPFLAATQVYDIRPIPRKWLALERTNAARNRFVEPGSIVVTCSGAVGRATLSHASHERVLISHDLLRVSSKDPSQRGWIYAYLRSPQGRAMMTSAKYGHMIKHLEVSHINALPVPVVNEKWAAEFRKQADEILVLRSRAHQLTLSAEAEFERVLGPLEIKDKGEKGFAVRASASLFGGRRRFEGAFHNPEVEAIRRHLKKQARGFTKLSDAGYDIWVPGRYKRIPAEDGVDYLDSADLLEVCPDITKRFADCKFGDEFRGRVRSGWLLVPCSGQVYGIIGSVIIAGPSLDGQVVSNHVMRIAPRPDSLFRAGYLQIALSHPKLGRPLVKALPFGSAVPEIDPEEFSALNIVRLSQKDENRIADMSESAGELRAKADIIERKMAFEAGSLIDKFMAGDMADFLNEAFH